MYSRLQCLQGIEYMVLKMVSLGNLSFSLEKIEELFSTVLLAIWILVQDLKIRHNWSVISLMYGSEA